jgi:hypothetical protein
MAKSTIIIRMSADTDDAIDRLQSMQDRMDNFGPVFAWAKRELERSYSNNFTAFGAESARAMLRGAWPPLDPQYASWKAANQPGLPMMIGPTASLFRSVSDLAPSPGNAASDTEATYFVDNPIAKFHQYGTEKMPARRLVFTPRDFDNEFGNKVAKYVKHGSQVT